MGTFLQLMIKRKFNLFILLALIGFFIGCSSSKKSEKSSVASNEIQVDKSTLLKNQNVYIKATTAKLSGDVQKALSLYNECIRQDPSNHAAMYELAKIYLESGQNVSALIFAQSAAKLNEKNKWYQQLYAEALATNNNFKEAAKIYEKLSEQHPNYHEYYLEWAYMLVNSGEVDKALKVYDKLEEVIGVNEQIVLQKQQFYLKQGKIEEAANEIQKLIDLDPEDPTYYGLMAELYDANDMDEKAAKMYEKMLSLDSDNPQSNLLIAEYYRKKGDDARYLKAIEKVISSDEVDIDTKVKILYPYIQITAKQEDTVKIEQGMELAKRMVEAHSNDAKAYALYGDLLYQNDQSKEALMQYKKATKTDNNNFTVWQQIMFIDSELGLNDSLLKHSNQVIELFPNQILPYYFNSVSNLLLKKYEAAIIPAEKALEIGTDNPILKSQLYSNLGDVYYNLKNPKASDSCFDKSLAFQPDNAYVLNNYSYYLSERGDNLDKAEKMSKKANELEPKNASFLDTYGWILYKQGNYKEAEEWVKKSLDNSEDEKSVVLDHYGDVLFKLGKTDRAIEYWKKAKEAGLDSEVIDQKIADKKLYE